MSCLNKFCADTLNLSSQFDDDFDDFMILQIALAMQHYGEKNQS